MESGRGRLLQHFRAALRADPSAAYRDWFRAQEELRERGDADTARALADDLWETLPALSFGESEARARFLHNAAVFFGSPGPAANLARARDCFRQALDHFAAHTGDGWRARVLHNQATAITSLGASAAELEEAVQLFEQALEWRTAEREIARGVTLHNQGLALRRLAGFDTSHAANHLEAAVSAFREAAEIRRRHALPDGEALSLEQLGLALEDLARARA